MNTKCRVVVADGDPESLAKLRECLERAGHVVVGCTGAVEDAIRLSRETAPDLMIVDIALGQRDGVCALSKVLEESKAPIVALAGHLDDEIINSASASHVFGFLSKPVREEELIAMVSIAVNQFHEFRLLAEEASSSRKALDDRKFIERAKGILMKKRGIDEATAFHDLQLLARNHRQKLVDVAKSILIAEEALHSS